jgi:hypothetical protein
MRHGGRSALVEEWIFRTERLAGQAELGDRRAQEGFSQFFNARNTRDQARRERLLEAQHVLPPLLWVMLLLAAALPIACVLLYADPKEDRVAQAFLAGSVVALITASLLAVRFLDTPFHGRAGSIRPTAMRYTVNLMFDEMRREDRLGTLPCDARGRPSAG